MSCVYSINGCIVFIQPLFIICSRERFGLSAEDATDSSGQSENGVYNSGKERRDKEIHSAVSVLVFAVRTSAAVCVRKFPVCFGFIASFLCIAVTFQTVQGEYHHSDS